MRQKLQFKKYRNIAEHFGLPVFYERTLSARQKTILQKCSQSVSKKKNLSSFGQKLQAKRLFAFLYGNLSRKSFVLLLKQASEMKGVLSSNFFSLLEKRLDIVVYKMFHFRSLACVRQFICHQGIYVNHTLVNLPQYQLQPGDIIRLQNPETLLHQTRMFNQFFPKFIPQKTDSQQPIKDLHSSFQMSEFPIKFPHFEVNYKLFTGIFLFSPKQIYSQIQIKKEDCIPKDFK